LAQGLARKFFWRLAKPGVQLDWRVERMKLSKEKRSLIYNDFLTLSGSPPEVFEYRSGNRSALEWIIDQYQVSTDKRSGITNDPNRLDDPKYIVRLIEQVITVSLETVKLVQCWRVILCSLRTLVLNFALANLVNSY